MANHLDRFVRAESRGSDLKSEIKKEVAKMSECDSRAQYRNGCRDRKYTSGGGYFSRSSLRSGKKYYGDRSDKRDVSRYGARSVEYSKDRDSSKYRDNNRERHVSRYRANSREGNEDSVLQLQV